MLEFLKHALGICGEHWHPNLLNISAFSIGISTVFYYIKNKVYEFYKTMDRRSDV